MHRAECNRDAGRAAEGGAGNLRNRGSCRPEGTPAWAPSEEGLRPQARAQGPGAARAQALSPRPEPKPEATGATSERHLTERDLSPPGAPSTRRPKHTWLETCCLFVKLVEACPDTCCETCCLFVVLVEACIFCKDAE